MACMHARATSIAAIRLDMIIQSRPITCRMIVHGKVSLQATHEHPQPLFVMTERQDKSKAADPGSETQ